MLERRTSSNVNRWLLPLTLMVNWLFASQHLSNSMDLQWESVRAACLKLPPGGLGCILTCECFRRAVSLQHNARLQLRLLHGTGAGAI